MRKNVIPERAEAGGALAEFAFVVPMLLALVLGIIDFGFAFDDYINIRQGSREATRQAVTGRIGSDVSCPVVAESTPNASVHRVICLAKDRVEMPAADLRVKIDVEGFYTDRKSLQVCVMARLQSTTDFYGFLLDGQVVQSGVQMRIEQTTIDVSGTGTAPIVDFAETPFPGHAFDCAAKATT